MIEEVYQTSMNKILVCQHVAHELLGTLNPLFKTQGFRIRYVNFGRHPDAKPALEGYDGLVILGGPMNVGQTRQFPHLAHEILLIESAFKRNIPILGICLGAQLMAKALGARVGPSPRREIGWYPLSTTSEAQDDGVLKHFRSRETVFQWHGDAFDIPKGGVRLATNENCPHQAFRFGDRAYGFQFHLEVDEPMVERWLKVPRNREELKELKGEFDPDIIRRESPSHIGRLKELSNKTFGEFINLFDKQKKFYHAGSKY